MPAADPYLADPRGRVVGGSFGRVGRVPCCLAFEMYSSVFSLRFRRFAVKAVTVNLRAVCKRFVIVECVSRPLEE